ncbi:MAG: MauE/DoxX family redox-associated membrane protein [Bacteroidota bacterium]
MITITSLITIIAVSALVLSLIFVFALGKKPKDWQETTLLYLQNFVGSLFIFSGFVKAIDPKGTAYKLEQYFGEFETVFAAPLSNIFPVLANFALAFSIFTIVLELILGVTLIFGIKRKLTSWIVLPLIIFFTVLTGFTYLSAYSPSSMAFMLIITSIVMLLAGSYLAKNKIARIVIGVLLLLVPGILINMIMTKGYTFNFSFGDWDYVKSNMKVTDCGCFGDFLKLEPMVSFWKDIVLLPPAIWFAFAHGKMTKVLSDKAGNIVLIAAAVLSFLFCWKNSNMGLPMADFRPFHVGANIPADKAACEADIDEIERYLTYSKLDGSEEMEIKASELTNHRYLWESGEWEPLKDKTRDVVIKKGCDSKVKDFEFSDANGADISGQTLAAEGYQFMVISYSLPKSSKKGYLKVNAIAEAAEAEGINTFAVTAFNSDEAIDEFRHAIQAGYEFHRADDILLKTIVRSNPGILLMKDGTIVEKWHHKKLPSYDKIKAKYMQ